MKIPDLHSVQNNQYQLRTETYQGRMHIVVPVIMMVEGVHSGSHGPILHTEEELSKFANAWNGRPVTIGHPERQGINISASEDPSIAERSVGVLFNTRMEGVKLKADAWIDEEKLKAVSPTALAYIKQGRPLDVSVGVFSDTDNVQGEWNGESYSAIARNYRPDHLALLPGERGACSWEDGCGIRINKEGGKMDVLQTLKELNQQGYSFSLINNAQGYMEMLNLIRSKIDSMDNEQTMYFLTEVYDDYIVYEKRQRTEGGLPVLYRQNYQLIDQNTKVEFTGDPVEVRRDVNYITMEMRRTVPPKEDINKNKGGTIMNEIGKTPCCLAKVEQLINHKLTHFSDVDKEWLLTQEEGTLDKLFPMEQKPESAPQVNREKALEVLSAELKTTEDYINIMPEDVQAQVNVGLKTYKEHRESKIQSIIDNSKDVWTKEELEVMTDLVLDKLSKSITSPIDYSGQGGGEPLMNNEEVLLPAGVEFKK